MVRLRVSLPDLDLGELLGELLPSGAELDALELDPDRLRIEAKVPMAGKVVLLADARFAGPELLLSNFRVEAGMLARAFLAAALSRRVARLDWRRGALRAWGEADGERLHLRWSDA